jgi:glycosyltransferase involved in cell wall biosynthesis
MNETKSTNVLFVSYDGLLDPLGQSQVLPYVLGLTEQGYKFTILSYEKKHRNKQDIEVLREFLNKQNIRWYPLTFYIKGGAWKFLVHILLGIKKLRMICNVKSFDFVHLRGYVSALIYKTSLLKIPYIYDYRSFTVDEWSEAGTITHGSYYYKVLKAVDDWALKDMSALVVLEKGAEILLKKKHSVPNIPVAIIRTSTDCRRYIDKRQKLPMEEMRFIHLGGVLFPYQVDVVLDFISVFSNSYKNISITFFNEGQHEQLKEIIDKSPLDSTSVIVESVNHNDVPVRLGEFDAGLVFIEPSPCRQVCSPTKLGEYLAGGLPVVGGKGIDVIDEMEEKFGCVYTVDVRDNRVEITDKDLKKLYESIKSESITDLCKKVAEKKFDITIAIDEYSKLYNDIQGES